MAIDDILTDPVAFKFTPKTRNDTYPFISPSNADLTGKYYLVTGASKGLGRAMVISLSQAGASGIAIMSRSSNAETIKLAHEAARKAGKGKDGPRILDLKGDTTVKADVDAVAAAVEREFGRLDVLVNNAGGSDDWVPITKTEPEDWWQTWEVNVRGVYLMDRALIPLLLKGGEKTIITVSSAGALATM
jgi:NAD(P)-dependent dehydrogenase (short-subunit alcohol dehydrogenase family)